MKIGESRTVEVATGGQPMAAMVGAVQSLAGTQDRWILQTRIEHDDDCPSLSGRGMGACTCEIVGITVRRVE